MNDHNLVMNLIQPKDDRRIQHLLDSPLFLMEDNLVLYTHAHQGAHTALRPWCQFPRWGPQSPPATPTHSLTWHGFPSLVPVWCRKELVGSCFFSAQSHLAHTDTHTHTLTSMSNSLPKGFSVGSVELLMNWNSICCTLLLSSRYPLSVFFNFLHIVVIINKILPFEMENKYELLYNVLKQYVWWNQIWSWETDWSFKGNVRQCTGAYWYVSTGFGFPYSLLKERKRHTHIHGFHIWF